MSRSDALRAEDVGAAMLAWYARAARDFPAGLITQAQAAAMLGVNRMAVNRLAARGHLRAVHFPRPPDVVGLRVGRDDPRWRHVADWLGLDPAADVSALPKACYVSFADVVRLWRSSEARDRCRGDWDAVLADLGLIEPPPAGSEPPGGQAEPETWML